MKIFSSRKFLKSLGSFVYCAVLSSYFAGNANSEEIKVKINFRSQSYQKSNIDKIKLNHPIRISQADITNHLISLSYKTSFLGSDRERIFSFLAIKKIAPMLAKAFIKVVPGRFIRVDVEGKGGLTSFDIFAFKKYLNWRFDSIHGETFFKKNDVRDAEIFAWNLIPDNGQKYFKTPSDKRIQKNWVVASFKLPIIKSGQEEKIFTGLGADSSSIKIDPKLEAKLKHLKYLHSKNLINDDEYKVQQKKLFDKHF